MKNIKQIIMGLVFAVCVMSASAQNYTYNSFINGFNLLCASTVTQTLVTNSFGSTNLIASGWGYNNYVYGGSYPITSNNYYIASNSIYGTIPAFGVYTNSGAIQDARIWPDNNSDNATSEGLFVSITGVNNTTTNQYALTFASVVDVPLNTPTSGSSSYLNAPQGSGTITNAAACTQTWNQFTLLVTANQLTPVNLITNLPALVASGAAKLRLLNVTMVTTNMVGYVTNNYYTSTLTNGVWVQNTNSLISTNYGGVYVNAGIVGYPPFHSP